MALKVGGSTVYKGRSGQWSFVLHRVTGFMVFIFLLLHVVDVSLINFQDGELYDEVHELYGNVLLRLFEVGLLFGLVFHAFNGVRIILVDFFPGMVRKQQSMSAWVIGLTLATCIPGGYIIMKPWLEGTF